MTTNPKDVLVEALEKSKEGCLTGQIIDHMDEYYRAGFEAGVDKALATINTLLGPEGEYMIVPSKTTPSMAKAGINKCRSLTEHRGLMGDYWFVEEIYKAMIKETEDAGTD